MGKVLDTEKRLFFFYFLMFFEEKRAKVQKISDFSDSFKKCKKIRKDVFFSGFLAVFV